MNQDLFDELVAERADLEKRSMRGVALNRLISPALLRDEHFRDLPVRRFCPDRGMLLIAFDPIRLWVTSSTPEDPWGNRMDPQHPWRTVPYPRVAFLWERHEGFGRFARIRFDDLSTEEHKRVWLWCLTRGLTADPIPIEPWLLEAP